MNIAEYLAEVETREKRATTLLALNQSVEDVPTLVAMLREAVDALTNLRNVDHLGKDQGFSACTEIAEHAMARLAALAGKEPTNARPR